MSTHRHPNTNTRSPNMLSTPPRPMTTRSCHVAGKKRPMSSPTGPNNNNNDIQTPPKTLRKQPRTPTKTPASTSREDAKTFSQWFQQMVDEDRHNFGLYLAEEVILEWFGRTIRTRKKVAGFMEYDMQCSRHDFTSVVGCGPFTARVEKSKRLVSESSQSSVLAIPLGVPETPTAKLKVSLNQLTVRGSSLKKRPGLRSSSASPEKRATSPEWERNSSHTFESDLTASHKKHAKLSHVESMDVDRTVEPDSGRGKSETKPRSVTFCRQLRFDASAADEGIEMSHRGDEGGRKYATTPAKREVGQGDCLPTTSATAAAAAYPTLPRKYVECDGFIEFTRSKNKRCAELMKWERKCKVKVSYTEDPVNAGEYVIWTMVYSDDVKCRRNLLAAFEEAGKVEVTRKRLF